MPLLSLAGPAIAALCLIAASIAVVAAYARRPRKRKLQPEPFSPMDRPANRCAVPSYGLHYSSPERARQRRDGEAE